MLLLTIWIMLYGSRDNRLYVLKDNSPTTVRQWNSEVECLADIHSAALPRSRCIEVISTPDCYNNGSACTINPTKEEDRQYSEKMVKPPEQADP